MGESLNTPSGPQAAAAGPTHTAPANEQALFLALHAALPQTQCTRCGYPDCAAYARAIASGQAPINQCPPGGQEGVQRLATLCGLDSAPSLNPEHGSEGPRQLALIDEDWCIGCTLCIKACPTDAIVGSNKRMHTVIEPWCTGCELCLPVCPVDCIALVNASGTRTGWAAWSAPEAATALQRYSARSARLQREQQEANARQIAKAQAKLADLPGLTHPPAETLGQTGPQAEEKTAQALARKRAIIEAALAKARERQTSQGDCRREKGN